VLEASLITSSDASTHFRPVLKTRVLHKIHTYAELRQQIHDDLRIQHPEWVEPSGESRYVIFTKRASWNCSTLTRKG